MFGSFIRVLLTSNYQGGTDLYIFRGSPQPLPRVASRLQLSTTADQATQDAMQGIMLKQLGIPVDDAKLAKKFKLSHLGDILDFDR